MIGVVGKTRILVMAAQSRTAVALIWHVGDAYKVIRTFIAIRHPDQNRGHAIDSEISFATGDLLDFSCVSHAVVRERHGAVAVEERTLAFWALRRCSQVLGHDEVLELQRVKHHDLHEVKAGSDRRSSCRRIASCSGGASVR
jgi:hypothetical protein